MTSRLLTEGSYRIQRSEYAKANNVLIVVTCSGSHSSNAKLASLIAE